MIYGTIRGIHFSWRSSIQNAFSELKQLLNGHFITFWLYFLTLLPLINIGELTFISKKIAIPEFITDEITKTSSGMIVYTGLIVVLLYFHARSALVIPLQILTDKPFTKNIVTSWKLTKKNTVRLLFISAVVEGVLAILVIFISLGSVALVGVLDPNGSNTLLLSSVLAIAKLLQGFIILYTKIATFIFMTKIIHEHKLASLEVYHHHEEIKHKRKIVTAFALLFVTGSGVLTTLTTYRKPKGKPTPTVTDLKNISDQEWGDVFKGLFWDKWCADNIKSQSIANILVDWVWASGKYGITIPQRILGVAQDGVVGPKTLEALNARDADKLFAQLKQARINFVETIVKRNPSQKKFINGWKRRIYAIQ